VEGRFGWKIHLFSFFLLVIAYYSVCWLHCLSGRLENVEIAFYVSAFKFDVLKSLEIAFA